MARASEVRDVGRSSTVQLRRLCPRTTAQVLVGSAARDGRDVINLQCLLICICFPPDACALVLSRTDTHRGRAGMFSVIRALLFSFAWIRDSDAAAAAALPKSSP
jgi:hypothetical protein